MKGRGRRASTSLEDYASFAVDSSLELAKFALSAARSLLGRVVAFSATGGVFGLMVFGVLYFGGLLDHPWPPWAWFRWLLLLLFPIGSAAALGWAAAWQGLGAIVIDAGVDSGLVKYVTEGLVQQSARTIPKNAVSKSKGAPDPSQWKGRMRKVLHDYVRADEPGTGGFARRAARRVKRFVGRIVVKLLLGRAELLALFVATLDGAAGAEARLVERVEELFSDAVEVMTSRPMFVTMLALPVGYAFVPIVLALTR